MIHDEDDEHIYEPDAACPAPACCPVCQQPLRYFPLVPSAVLDWLTLIQEDMATLDTHIRDLKQSVEQGVLP
jgi:hypothetical protein